MTMTMTSSLGTILVVGYGDEPFVQIRCLSWSGISVYGMRMAISGVRMRFFSSIPRNGCCGPGCLQGRTFRGLPLWTVGWTKVTKEDGRATESQLVVRPDQAHCRASPCWDARCEIRTLSDSLVSLAGDIERTRRTGTSMCFVIPRWSHVCAGSIS